MSALTVRVPSSSRGTHWKRQIFSWVLHRCVCDPDSHQETHMEANENVHRKWPNTLTQLLLQNQLVRTLPMHSAKAGKKVCGLQGACAHF